MARKDINPGKKEAAAERRVQALELRKAGLGYHQIGEHLKVSHTQAWKDVQAALKELSKVEQGKAAEYRQLELERLDSLLAPLLIRARGRQVKDPVSGAVIQDTPPDYEAFDRVLRLLERRSKLLGIEPQPTQAEEDRTVRIIVEHATTKQRGTE